MSTVEETGAGLPGAKAGTEPDAKDDLKSLPVPEVQKRLGSSPEGLSQAEAQERLARYGPNEIEEKKENPLLKLLTYFWGPIPWMIEAAVIFVGGAAALAGLLHHPAAAGGQRHGRVLGGTPGGQGHRCAEGAAGGQVPGAAGRRLGHPAVA